MFKNKTINRQLSVLMITFVLFSILFNMNSCKFFQSFSNSEDEKKKQETEKSTTIEIDSLSLGKTNLNIKVGTMEYISVSVRPQKVQKNLELIWSYDESVIECDTSSNWGVTIKGLKEGQTKLKCSYKGYDAVCLITVSGIEKGYETSIEPYIYSNTTILQTSPGITEKVFVSLHGGDSGDLDGYTWTVDNSSVVSIQPTGQYCMITGKEAGYTRIKVTHIKASYPYYIGVYVFADATKVTYITTQNNIVTMKHNDSDQTIIVNLVNGKNSSVDNDFSWEIINDSKNSVSTKSTKDDEINKDDKNVKNTESPIKVESNGNKAVVTPVGSGSCTLRITHPDAAYPLDILCRVIKIIENVYILPDSTVVTIDGEEEKTVTSSLKNTKDANYSVNEYKYVISDTDVAEIVNTVGEKVILRGKTNGSCKLIISHQNAAYAREVLIIVTGQLSDAVDASCYITTSQNYIRTKIGAEPTTLNISLKGGEEGDEALFEWAVRNAAGDDNVEVISLETTDGTIYKSRAALFSFAYGTAYITPKSEGTAVITVTHPKIVYPTEIIVKVLPESAILEEPLYFVGSGLIKVLNGETYDYNIKLKGNNLSDNDEEKIEWAVEDERISVIGDGKIAHVNAPPFGTGCTTSYISASHPKCESDKAVLVMTADDIETLNSMKALYSNKLYYSIEAGNSVTCMAQSTGFETEIDDEGNEIRYDFSSAVWTTSNPSVASVEKTTYDPLSATVKGLRSGVATVSVTVAGVSCNFTINVYPKGSMLTEPEIYFTTNSNVICIGDRGDSTVAYITAINLPYVEYSNILWECDDSSVATVIPNGDRCTITAVNEGETVINVSHPDAQNTIKMYVRVGSEYIKEGETGSNNSSKILIPYIKVPNVISVIKSDPPKKISASLADYTGSNTDGFSFSIADENVARLSATSSNGTAFVKGISSGTTEITVSNIETNVQKKILIIVSENENEMLKIQKQVYLTTSNNVVSFNDIGERREIKISAVNLEPSLASDVVWKSLDESVATVIGNGTSATIIAEGKGITEIYATYVNSLNSLAFYTFVSETVQNSGSNSSSDSKLQAPYISVQNVFSMFVGENDKKLSAMLNGKEGTYTDGFSFSIADESIAKISSYSTNGTAYIKPISAGYTEITVSHTYTDMTRKVLVVIQDSNGESQEAATETPGILATESYLTIPNNVVTFDHSGMNRIVKISAMNVSASDYHNITWTSSDESIISVIANGTSAFLTANKDGEAFIYVNYPYSINSLKLYVFVGKETIENINNGGNGNESGEGTNVNGNGINNLKLSSTDIEVTAVRTSNVITFTAEEGCDSYSWILDGMPDNVHSNVFCLETDGYMPGEYEMSLLCLKNGMLYSILIQFTI